MAIKWGTAITTGSGNGMRLGYELTQSPASVGAGTSSVTVTLKLYVGTRRSVFDSNNSWSLTGDFSGSGSVNISHSSSSEWSNSNVTLIATRTRSVSPSYANTIASSFAASLSGIAPIPGTVRVSGSITTGRRPISAPATPTNAVVTRNSDTQQTITWSNTSPAAAATPYQNLEVERWDTQSNAWKRVGTVGVVTSYVDRTTSVNNQYRYRVRAKNSAGTSGYVYTDYMSTTPVAPSLLKAAKTASGDIVLNWTNNSPKFTGAEIWLTENGVDKPARHVLVSGSSVSSWTHTNPAAGSTWSYRVRTQAGAAAGDAAPDLYSPFSTRSNTVQLLTNPKAPTGMSPASTAFDATEPVTFTWQHNDADGTDQTAYEIQYRVGTGAWVSTGKINSTVSARTFPANTFTNGVTINWQVRTYGGYATAPAYSPWSTVVVNNTSTRPTVVIQSPTGTVDTSVLTVRWAYYDQESTPQSQWRATLLSGTGEALETRSGAGTTSTATFKASIADGSVYGIRVEVRDGHGMWSAPEETSIVVEYALPEKPSITGTYDQESGAMILTISNHVTTEGRVETDHNVVSRSINGGDWVIIADNVPNNASLTDFLPVMNGNNHYKVTAVSALPSALDSEPTLTNAQDTGYWVRVNAGPAFSVMVKIRDNAKITIGSGRQKTLHRFAGRTKPVEFVGEQRTRDVTLSARFAPESSTPEEIEYIADLAGVACIREPSGRRLFVSMGDPDISYVQVIAELGWNFTETDYVE